MKFVLVTGAAGYLGRYVCQELKQQGHRVRALVRDREPLWKRGETLAPAVGAKVDEIVSADLTQPQSLRGICHKVDAIISCASLSGKDPQASHEQVDYHGNRNLLIEAINAGSVDKYIFVSMLQPPQKLDLEIATAKEKFVQDLQHSVMTSYVIRPSLFYSELLPILYMAHHGRVWLPGNGKTKLNPIHGLDLARLCVKGLIAKEKEVDVGGPTTYSLREIAQLAFKVLDKPARISEAPGPLSSMVGQSLSLFGREKAQAFDFLRSDVLKMGTAPPNGKQSLEAYFQEYLKSSFFRVHK